MRTRAANHTAEEDISLVLLAGSPTFQDESEKLRTKQKALAISK